MKAAGYGLTLLGVLFLVFGGWVGYQTWIFVERAIPTSGEVVDAVPGNQGGALIRFQTRDSQTLEFLDNRTMEPESVVPGEEVRVLYNGDDPSRAVRDDPSSLWALTGVAVLLGFLFMMLGAGLVLVARISGRRAALERCLE